MYKSGESGPNPPLIEPWYEMLEKGEVVEGVVYSRGFLYVSSAGSAPDVMYAADLY